MQITLKNKIQIKKCPQDIKNQLADQCTITNPKFQAALRLEKSTYNLQQHLRYYDYCKSSDTLTVPIGLIDVVKNLLPHYRYDDKRAEFENKSTSWKFLGNLRDYQDDMAKSLKNNDIGICEAMTGSGKTVVIIKHIMDSNRPTLIMVNTIELANQMTQRILEFTNLTKDDIGRLGDGRRDIKPLTVCLLQTMAQLDDDTIDELNAKFSQVITDETHIIAAETYYSAISRLDAKYKYGFSATPKREDGLTNVLTFATGPKIHVVPKEALKNTLLLPTYRSVDTDYYYPLFNTSEFQYMLSDMALDNDRNSLILAEVRKYDTQQVVILCNRSTQVLYLHDNIPDSEYLLSQIPELNDDYSPVYYKGKTKSKIMPKKRRKEVIENLNSGKTRVIISTYGLFSTGIDIAGLEILLLASPIKSSIKLTQSIGRLMRKSTCEKQPEIVDFIDKKVELLMNQARSRAKTIKRVIET